LWTAALVLFTAAGAGLLGIPGLSNLWQIFAAAGGFISLILLALFWHPWLVLGVLINLTILGGVITGWFTRWFPIQ
jgi:predicted exporter